MATAIRKHLRDFIAIAVLFVAAVAVTAYVVQEQRLRIPVLEERPFELRAEMADAGAVVAGQGQSIRVAGVKIGDVSDVELDDGVAVVSFGIERDYLPIYRDATLLLRPQTGLEDMFFELDPGTKAAGEYEEGETIPVANTAPDVELHEILEALDSDTQAYLRLLLVGAGEGLAGRDRDLAQLLGGLGPINRDLKQLNSEVAARQRHLSSLIHNFRVLTTEIARSDEDLSELVTTSNTALGAIAEQDPNVQRAVALLPGTLSQARQTLDEVSRFAAVLGPTFDELRPFARNLEPMNASLVELAESSTSVLRDEVRPFVRSAREPIPDLRRAADRYAAAAPRLTTVGRKINRLGNMAAYNPRGPEEVGVQGRDEGYLFWGAWLGHNGNLVFNTADGNGPFRRIYFTAGCDQLSNIVFGPPDAAFDPATSRLEGIISGLGEFIPARGVCNF